MHTSVPKLEGKIHKSPEIEEAQSKEISGEAPPFVAPAVQDDQTDSRDADDELSIPNSSASGDSGVYYQ